MQAGFGGGGDFGFSVVLDSASVSGLRGGVHSLVIWHTSIEKVSLLKLGMEQEGGDSRGSGGETLGGEGDSRKIR